MAKLYALATILWTLSSNANANATLDFMNTLQPRGDHYHTAQLIDTYAAKYSLNPLLVVALAMQESSLLPNNHRKAGGRTTDLGLLQLNEHTIKARGLDIASLSLSDDYYWNEACKFLALKLEHSKGKTPWANWNSSKEPHHSTYARSVARWLRFRPLWQLPPTCTNSTCPTTKLSTTATFKRKKFKVRIGLLP
jgi:hypothetical protein